MKKPIIVIVIIAIAISASVFAVTSVEQPEKNTSDHFNYRDTRQVISEKYLGKTISEWQKEDNESLMSYYEIHKDFFTKLGALVVKNEMLNELRRQNIQPKNPDFDVYPGMILTSLPPHVSFEAFVNDTDNNTYRISGMTQRAKVGDIHMTKLEFFDTGIRLPIDAALSENNTVAIMGHSNRDEVIPRNLVIHSNKDIEVRFKNTLPVPIRIQGDGDWQDPNWYGPTVLPFSTASMTFENPGAYDWHARTLPPPGSTSSEHMGGGQISIIPDDTDRLSFEERQRIGAAILQNSEIPWAGMGSGSNGITIDFNRAILDAIPNATQYYKERAEQLIPFDVPIIIGEP